MTQQPAIGRIASAPVPFEMTLRKTELFLTKLGPVREGGCRLWLASTDAYGYGQFHIEDRMVKAHLAAWVIERGAFPEGLEPDHTCNVRACTSVEHLEWVTHAENNRRIGERAEFCRAGLHRWSEQVSADSRHRACRPCRQARRRAHYAETGRS